MDPTAVADLVHAGGAVALAVIVWFELRGFLKALHLIRKDLEAHRTEEARVLADAVSSLETLVNRFAAEDEARETAAKVREVIRKEISDVHDRPTLGDDDDTPIDSPRAERKKLPRAPSSPYFYGPTKKDKGDKDR